MGAGIAFAGGVWGRASAWGGSAEGVRMGSEGVTFCEG